MKALRVRKRASTGGRTVHWLLDDERTMCGRRPDEFDVDEELELEKLPTLEACHGCLRAVENWPTAMSEHERAERRYDLPPSTGTLRKTGPLAHGPRRHRGQRLR